MIRRLRAVDHAIMTLNLLLLLCVAVLPYVTSLMAAYLKASSGQHLAAAIYSGAFLVMSLVFAATQRHILFTKAHLLSSATDEPARRVIFVRALSGLVPYAVATVLAPVSAYLSLAICGAVALYYALPFASARPGRRTGLTVADGRTGRLSAPVGGADRAARAGAGAGARVLEGAGDQHDDHHDRCGDRDVDQGPEGLRLGSQRVQHEIRSRTPSCRR